MKNNILYIECSCHSHLLTIEREIEGVVPMWYVSYWSRGRRGEESGWVNKLRHIYKILKDGSPYNDDIILQKEEMEKLRDYLNEQLK